jgi:predicted nucleotidyltransferase
MIERFVAACEADERVLAAFLGGSHASGKADPYSDYDIYVVTSDEGYEGFFKERQDFMRLLGEPVVLEDFNEFGFDMILFTYADGTEGELALAPESNFDHIHGGPYKVLVDKNDLLAGKVFPMLEPTEADQLRALRKSIFWFWESLSHFITALNREQSWTAFGSLNEMRARCLNVARLRHDFGQEARSYFDIERIVPEGELTALKQTFVPLDQEQMIKAAKVLIEEYQRTVPEVAREHEIEYPSGLERVLLERLDKLSEKISG